MRVQIEGDLISSVVSGDLPGVDIPTALLGVPTGRLRFNGQIFIDIAEVGQFYIDGGGVKHLLRLDPSWPRLSCAWDADLRLDGGQWVAVSPADAQRASLFAFAASRRWQREIAGIVVEGLSVPTDERTQMVLTGAYARAISDPSYAITRWKVGEGAYIGLSNEQIRVIGQRVTEHIQACFDRNAEVDEAISAGEVTTESQIEAMFAAI